MLRSIVLLSCLSLLVKAAHLPSYFTVCSQDDNFKRCILDNIEKNWKDIVQKGDKSVRLANLNPMKIKKMSLQASESLQVDLNDLEFRGFDTCVVTDVKMEPANEHLDISFICQYLEMIGTYNLNGKILILPIQGNGKINMTIVKPKIDFNSKLEVIEKEGEKYYNISPLHVAEEPDKVYYNLDNLFNGDKRLGDEMNKFLNENWKEVFQEIGAGVGTVIGVIAKTVANAFFNNIPINEIHH